MELPLGEDSETAFIRHKNGREHYNSFNTTNTSQNNDVEQPATDQEVGIQAATWLKKSVSK